MPPVLIQEAHTLVCVNLVFKEMDSTVVQVRLLLTPLIITLPYMCLCTADINECLTNNGSCHSCSNTDGSYECYCNSGFKVVEYEDGVLNKTCIGKGYCMEM